MPVGRIQFEVYHTLSSVLDSRKKNVWTNFKQRVGDFILT